MLEHNEKVSDELLFKIMEAGGKLAELLSLLGKDHGKLTAETHSEVFTFNWTASPSSEFLQSEVLIQQIRRTLTGLEVERSRDTPRDSEIELIRLRLKRDMRLLVEVLS